MRALVPTILLVAACGNTRALTDAPPIVADAGPDAVPVPGTVNVTVLTKDDNGAPAPGTQVVFVDPAGAVVSSTTADPQGHASADVLPGSTVYVIRLVGNFRRDITAVVGVKPGDDLRFGTPDLTTTTRPAMIASWPQPLPGIQTYVVRTPCSDVVFPGSVTGGTIPFDSRCGATFDIAVLAMTNGFVQRYNYLTGQTHIGGGAINFTAAEWRSPEGLNVAYSDVPTTVGAIDVTTTALSDGRPLYAVLDALQITGTTATGNPYMPQIGTTFDILASVTNALDSSLIQRVGQRVPRTTSYQAALRPALGAWVATVAIDLPTETISWTTVAGAPANVVVLDGRWYRFTNTRNYYWRWVLPASAVTAETFTYPDLPPEMDEYEMTIDDQANFTVRLFGFDAGVGYDGVRDQLDFRLREDGTHDFFAIDPAITTVVDANGFR